VTTQDDAPRLYGDLAGWFHLLTAPADYAAGAAHAVETFTDAIGAPPATILELGSGGGNTASHLKAHTALTLTDLSPAMLELSRSINPECEHLQGDMRTLRLGRTFDAVFVHDAISYLTTEEDLRAALATAFVHLRPGGAAIFEPDHVRETYVDGTHHGGHDGGPGDGRSLRYLEWRWDPEPSDDWYLADYAYLLRDVDGTVRAVRDRHRLGMFPRATWFRLLDEVGFVAARSCGTGYDDEEVGAEGFLGVTATSRKAAVTS
jgi:SAM-dependent methyltransferase